MIRVRADDLLYPAIYFPKHDFYTCKDLRALMWMGPGLFVDREARCYRVLRGEDPFYKNGRSLTWEQWRAVTDWGWTFVCEGEPFSTTVDKLRLQIASRVSARGHFESPTGFGLSPDLDAARTVSELVDVLDRPRELCDPYGVISPWSKPLSILN